MSPLEEKYLYEYSPFRPLISIESANQIISSVEKSVHGAVAIAQEVQFLSKLHLNLFVKELPWISEKFSINSEGVQAYVYGLMIPSTLLLAMDMIQEYSHEETFARLLNSDGEDWVSITKFYSEQMKFGRRIVRWYDRNPSVTGKLIYDHCNLVVYSINPWYLVGVAASRQLFNTFAQLFEPIREGS